MRNHNELPATLEDYVRAPRAYAWSQEAAMKPELMFGEGSPILYIFNHNLWQRALGSVSKRQAGTVNLSQFVRAFDVQVCNCLLQPAQQCCALCKLGSLGLCLCRGGCTGEQVWWRTTSQVLNYCSRPGGARLLSL